MSIRVERSRAVVGSACASTLRDEHWTGVRPVLSTAPSGSTRNRYALARLWIAESSWMHCSALSRQCEMHGATCRIAPSSRTVRQSSRPASARS